MASIQRTSTGIGARYAGSAKKAIENSASRKFVVSAHGDPLNAALAVRDRACAESGRVHMPARQSVLNQEQQGVLATRKR